MPHCLNEIQAAFDQGKSLVPFIGAGFSVEAGLPTTFELETYLKLCVGMVLFESWHPTISPWPSMTGDWKKAADRVWKRVLKRVEHHLTGRKLISDSDDYAQAYGALSDWRLALQFLARVRPPKHIAKALSNGASKKLEWGPTNPNVIDSFFAHITQNKVPSMGHRMLAYFAESLRSPVTLTLNFDDLLEQAYREAQLSPQLFEVHHKAPLPPWSALGFKHSLIKLHGGKYGLRADFSLDEEPTEEDKRNFRSYLLRRDWTSADDKIKPMAFADLLVIGISGSDPRVILLVRDALESLEGLNVYWHCFNEDARIRLMERFKDNRGVHPIEHLHAGTWLWEIYQRIMRCVPPGGLEFPSTWQMPYPPELSPEEEKAVPSHEERRAMSWEECSEPVLQLCSPVDEKREWGVSLIGWKLFRLCRGRGYRCIWLDAEDIKDECDFRVRLYQAVCSALGQSHTEPALDLATNEKEFCEELHDRLNQSGSPWMLFLNLRGSHGYGCDIFTFLNSLSKDTNRDRLRSRLVWGDKERERVATLCLRLEEMNSDLRIVALTRGEEFCFIKKKNRTRRNFITCIAAAPAPKWALTRVTNVIEAIKGQPIASKVLHAFTLFPQIRHISALVTRAISNPNKTLADTWSEVAEAIQVLVEHKIVRQKFGGFLWMHWQVREELRNVLLPQMKPVSDAYVERAILHVSLADWSVTFFGATKDPKAIFQAVFHRCRSAELFLKATQTRSRLRGSNKVSDLMIQFRSALCEANNHLEAARANIVAWGNHLDAQRCLGGFSEFLKALCTSIQSQSGSVSERNLRCILPLRAKALTYKIWFARDLGRLKDVAKTCKELEHFLNNEAITIRCTRAEARAWNLTLKLERVLLLISQRRYEDAVTSLGAFLARDLDLRIDVRNIEELSDKQLLSQIHSWIHRQSGSDRFVARRFALCAFRRLAEVRLLQHELRKLLSFLQKDSQSELPLLEQAERYYFAGRLIPRFVAEDELSHLSAERSRLHSIRAGILSVKGDHEGVRRYINEALIAATNLPESEASIANSVIELRQIYGKLMQIFELKSLEEFAQTRFWTPLDLPSSKAVATADIRKTHALLEDIKLLLDRVEARMNRGRKTLFWWMTLQRYKITWFQYRELLRAVHRETRDSSIGNRDSQVVDPESDRDNEMARIVLRTTLRRVQHDAFQLARTAYAGLVIARLTAHAGRHLWIDDLKNASTAISKIRESQETDSNVEMFLNSVRESIGRFIRELQEQ